MKRVAVEPQLRPVVGEVAVHQVEGEDVVAGGDGRMGGEDGVGGGDLARDLEVESSPCTSSRQRSRPRKAAWPSFMCQTVGSMPSARRARTPPMPSTISWAMRISWSPP